MSYITTYTSQIYNIFDQHSRNLYQEKAVAEENIDAWARTLRFTIDEHVREQKVLLGTYYNDRRGVLDKKREECINDVYKFNSQYDYNQINNLIDQCRRLQFQLSAAFDYKTEPISFILCVTKEHLEQKKRNESHATKTSNRGPETVPNTQGSFRDSAFITEPQDARPSATPKPTNISDRSTGGSNSRGSQNLSNNDPDDKCPICYMLYPGTMPMHEREQHVHEHYG